MTHSFTSSGLFGTLLQDQQVAALFAPPAYLAQMIAFEMSWTKALAATGAVSADAATQALARMAEFTPDLCDLASGSDRDGLPVPEMVRLLKQGLGHDVQAAIHTGATSQDVMDTATVLTCRAALDIFGARLTRLCAALEALGDQHGGQVMMGRTRMQAALPIHVADRLRSWRDPLVQHFEALPVLRATIGKVQIGGAVGLRAAPTGRAQQVAAFVAQDLGLALTPVWHADRSAIVDMGHWLTKVSGTLGKIGQDIALMAQQGVDEVRIAGAGGSSAMPHKQNPVRAELLVALARMVAGLQGILGQAMIHEQERSGAAWALEWLTLPQMCEATGAALTVAEALLDQITRLGAAADGSTDASKA